MHLLVRDVAAGDFAAWKPLWDGYNAFYGRSGPTALPGEITATTWSRFLDPHEPMHALLAERSGRLLGIAHYIFHRSTIHVRPTCYLQDLFTSADARGQRVGRTLIETVYARAAQAGSARVYWLTHESNANAMHLYDRIAEKSGFLVYRQSL
ncbi:MAG: GNAT family N-acetyltransferase [Rudaea sp.]